MNNDIIKKFVQQTLGCTCPDDVFQYIDCQSKVDIDDYLVLNYQINIGNKLLIYIASVDESISLVEVISELVQNGIRKRTECGFNRFRLVLMSKTPSSIADEVLAIFNSFGCDDKVHLHIISENDFPSKL